MLIIITGGTIEPMKNVDLELVKDNQKGEQDGANFRDGLGATVCADAAWYQTGESVSLERLETGAAESLAEKPKVYGNPEEAKRRFAQYRRCAALY